MDLQELIRTITLEVLARLQERPSRPCVLVLAERGESQAARVRELLPEILSAIQEEGVDLIFLGEDASGRTPIRCILPSLSCEDMADLAAGRACGPLAAEVLRLLLAGTKVEVLNFAYRAYAKTAPAALYALYQAHEKTLIGYGLTAFKPKPASIEFTESLVTAAVIERAHKAGAEVVQVPAGAKITPLAMDTAKSLRITILTSCEAAK